MHILFLTQVLPYPLDAGAKVRAYYTLRFLAQKHTVTLLSFVRPSDPPDALEHLREICERVYTVTMPRSRLRDAWHFVRSLVYGEPFLIARDWVPVMVETLETMFSGEAGFDAIHADQLWMAPYALQGKEYANGATPLTVLDQHNAVFQIPRRLAQSETNLVKRAMLAWEARKLQRYERQICRQFDRVVWVTEEDQSTLNARTNGTATTSPNGATRWSTIPICVDPTQRPVVQRHERARRVTFLGGLHWPPNAEGVLWFVENVWPEIHDAVPEAVLTIIGKNPPTALERYQRAGAGIEVTGYVADPMPYLAETGAFIVPLHAGGGMRVKILDAWSWGLPIVSTSIGAEGIHVQSGENILLADTPEEFTRGVVRLLDDPVLANRLAAGGRHTVEQQYDWRLVYRAWEQAYSEQ